MPLPLATVEELLGQRRFDRLEPHELAALYRLMSQLELATPRQPYAALREASPRRANRPPANAARQHPHRRHSDPPRAPPAAHRSAAAGDAVRHLGLDGAVRARLPAVPDLRRRQRSARRGVRLRDAADLADASVVLSRNSERAIQLAAAAPDWSSGTRIGDALREFNDRHGRRGMARGAVIVIISDGWERGDPTLVGRELERLGRLDEAIVWVNPRLSAAAFSVQSGGMLAALPHCDALVSGHSYQALAEVVDAIGAESWEPPAVPAEAEAEEPWASATPVPGSSVAMPMATARAGGTPPRAGAPMSETSPKLGIYPGCD